MTTFKLNIAYSGVDLDDEEVLVVLARTPHILWRSERDLAFAVATIEADSAVEAAELLTRTVAEGVPSACPIRVDEDLVAISDISSRIGVTREAVRNWANGTRHANFPLPRGVVGDAIRVWTWSDVSEWLSQNLGLGDNETFPTPNEILAINASFSKFRRQESVAAGAEAEWNVARTLSTSTETQVPTPPTRSAPWVDAGHRRLTSVPLADDSYVAA